MKKLLMGAAALAAMSATSPAFAQAVSDPASTGSFPVSGFVNATCGAVLGQPLQFNQLQIDPGTGALVQPGPVQSQPQPAFCNGVSSQLTLAATPLVTSATPTSPSFTNTINYTADANLAGVPAQTDTIQGTVTVPLGSVSGPLVVAAGLLVPAGGLLPVAGNYSGTITVTLTPGV